MFHAPLWNIAPVNGLPQEGGGESNPGKIFDIFRFSNTLGLHFELNTHFWGELIRDLHNLYFFLYLFK